MGLRYLALYLYMSTNLKAMPGCNEPCISLLLLHCQIGGGSLRIYKREIQQKVLEIVGITPEQVRSTLCYMHFWLSCTPCSNIHNITGEFLYFHVSIFLSLAFIQGELCKSRMNSETLEIICVRIKTSKLDFKKSTCFYSGWEFFMFGFVFLLRHTDKLSKKGKTQVKGVYH